ncbi:hypothetical protein QVD17_17660 [Tagetes erecta]|uniref:Uncharacterized protein n=1 Tax=Tagetes erecta TaxID=13708 RepID=A0AAD8NUJ7_TARER|nr:hypothetical protein QVD17_17660 [Tagetes erecta]
MNSLLKLRTCSVFKSLFSDLAILQSIKATGLIYIAQNPRFYSSKTFNQSKLDKKSNELTKENSKTLEAQEALIEYFHSTRNFQYLDAENISRNSPYFVQKLLKSVKNDKDAKQSLRRLFCYNPVNEFEPFFESMGMKPSEYALLLPRDMMYLADDQRLLSNYHVLCEYGISPNKIGKIYIDACEVFRYDHGVLLSQLKSLETKGFSKPCVVKLVTACPDVLVNDDSLKVLEALTDVGIVHSWFEEHILAGSCYNWSKIFETLCLIKGLGFSKEDLKDFLCKHPTVLMEESGATFVSVIVFLIKFGASVDDVFLTFKHFPQIKIQVFQSNLKNCYQFLLEIEMDNDDIANIIHTHTLVLGSCMLKTVKSLLNGLKTGKKRLCDIVKENPLELENWVLGKKVKALPDSRNGFYGEKIQFLLNLGYIENSDEMSKALKLFRGNGGELQDRFDCLVNAGLTRDAVAEMVKTAPQIINQTKEVIEMKIDLLVNGLGYNVSSLVKFPAFLAYSIQKIKLRFAMYNWLTDRGKTSGKLALSTILASPDRVFVRVYVDRDPEGSIVWDEFKKQFFPNEKDV